MKKINSKGFALVETLIVSAFVVGIFTMMFVNFYPMIGEYEKRENYDDISSIYKANLFKMLIENNKDYETLKQSCIDKIKEEGLNSTQILNLYAHFFPENKEVSIKNDDTIVTVNIQEYFDLLEKQMDMEKIYITSYSLKNIDTQRIDSGVKDYIKSLPQFKKNDNNLGCRIIVKFKNDANRESNKGKSNEYSYATIGVDC